MVTLSLPATEGMEMERTTGIAGHFYVIAPYEHTDATHETAAWWNTYTVLPGVYPVTTVAGYTGGDVRVNATHVDEYFGRFDRKTPAGTPITPRFSIGWNFRHDCPAFRPL